MQLVYQLVVGINVRHKVGRLNGTTIWILSSEQLLVEGKVGDGHGTIKGDRHKLGNHFGYQSLWRMVIQTLAVRLDASSKVAHFVLVLRVVMRSESRCLHVAMTRCRRVGGGLHTMGSVRC